MAQIKPNEFKSDLIVVGGGPAGVTAALRARELGASVTLVERNRMGGTCTNDGCVPTRVLAHTARLLREAEQFPEYGLISDNPKLDFTQVMRRAAQVVYTIQEKKQLIGHLADVDVQVFSEVGEARFLDAHTLGLPDGRRLSAEKFILCAGGRARRLDFPGAELALTHSDVWALKALPSSVIIVGAAATGCQLASIFAAFGAEVTLLERSDHILGNEDQAIAEVVRQAFHQRGLRIITGIEGLQRIEGQGNSRIVHYTHNGQDHQLQAQAVMLSTGWVGNLSGLNLPAAGVETIGHYIPVNDYLQTNQPHIFAAGDITGRMMLVQSAGYEALAAAENAVLGSGHPEKHPIVPHGGFTDPEYASVGLTEAQAQVAGEYLVAQADYRELDRAVIDNRTAGLCKLIVSPENNRILGAHVVGEQALEIVHMAAAGMAAGMWVEQLADLQIAYPTYTAIIGLAARKITRQLGLVPLTPEWRSLEKHQPHKSLRAEWELGNSSEQF
ncbi:MAG TPA: NAD(P)/FAD-dependent oxidoreductase [Chloroflexi bacterium]|nr:NAD(P)/FAD-dependent oxidoreductase [Chloroflexota bacterium]HBY09567.1 NAD(P)/FAD-dependent oxidoreductase [Chloroflexota bacterium]